FETEIKKISEAYECLV
ncbi:hypothetical protein XELAEV_1801385810mg, partial [Xenopus laevis]